MPGGVYGRPVWNRSLQIDQPLEGPVDSGGLLAGKSTSGVGDNSQHKGDDETVLKIPVFHQNLALLRIVYIFADITTYIFVSYHAFCNGK